MTDEQTNEKEVTSDVIDEVADFCESIGRAGPKLRRLSAMLKGQVHEEDSQPHPENRATEKGEGDE